MKNLCSCLSALILLASCSDDTGTNTTPDPTATTAGVGLNPFASRGVNELPANSDNQYDSAGKLHNEILYGYYNTSSLPTSLSGIKERVILIANGTAGFNECKGPSYHEVNLLKVQSILDNPTTCVSTTINGTGMTAGGKANFITFTNRLIAFVAIESNYNIIYDYICNYETGVIGDLQLTAKDKKVILISTSIARHAMYCSKKRPKKNTDPDWTVFVGNIMGGTYGSDIDTAEAITTGLVTGIAQN